ncbi:MULTISPECIES: sulfide/dihydroorotate dehydrogenase-like FAD/NAD-binding protein [Coprobacillaceae]|uniref:sulfide/dihydroorotate dehydrogenase-like FAD/NAD-binding protein n=1 Tax=Coprobacillaceae TaxID=2810280 RepID=UPI000E4801C3|nr:MULTISPECIES: sulfide/dihydroorotate dehydrogenase-like FAD/NAD-binding protein [Coprobacillaceae]RHM63085.1 sulfide/dihydroorotate dehydrogenase-like FAD/NAD-binding protein [Coprobacillus sp. AF33-1AC]RHS94831.1 sulfide/dihydroorotate dehydrogenase-like FAD/NAD-binding protein [Erysipelatoclostridium sp. AM42-17]
MYKIVKKERLNDVVELMEVHAPMVARKCEPGQFIILRVGEDGERIPLTIADYDREKETITIIYQIVGYSTKQLAKLEEGDEITDFVGPLGVPTDLHKSKHVVGIAGGVGSAPLYPQLKKLAQMGVDVDVIIGGREAQYVLWADKFKEFCKNVYVMTDDGSLGEKGFGTVKLQELIDSGDPIDEVIAIGPVVMMKAVVGVTKPQNIKTMVSLNPIMIDGTGMCGCCRVTVDGKIKFACVDGPDFDGLQVDFDELMARQRMFKEEEHVVDEKADRICNLMGGVK